MRPTTSRTRSSTLQGRLGAHQKLVRKTKLQELAGEIEDNVNIDNEGLDSYDFS